MPTRIVATTRSAPVSITDTVPSASFETYARRVRADGFSHAPASITVASAHRRNLESFVTDTFAFRGVNAWTASAPERLRETEMRPGARSLGALEMDAPFA